MKILVIGSGGREHALVWKVCQSPRVKKIYCAPGNPGIAQLAECVDISASNVEKLMHFADDQGIDLTVVGPEAPLVQGIVDEFESQGLLIFGPSKRAAEIEGSKAFAKYLMDKYKIPTADCIVFTTYQEAANYVQSISMPAVIKADGLAGGKGSIVCRSHEEALAALDKIMVERIFGDAGNRVLLEEFLEGEEASVLAFTDGVNVLPMAAAQDHKPIFDGDEGPNTGGMGAYAPAPLVDQEMLEQIRRDILQPAIKGMALEDRPYRGVLYAGLMITANGPKVVEFNCRFGDPETQAILPLMKSDLVELMIGVRQGTLSDLTLEEEQRWAVCVVMASGGYPGAYAKGKAILGLERDFGDDVFIFHAGTKLEKDTIVTDGGRVLGITAVASELEAAIEKVYWGVGKIAFDGAYYRKDIGAKALNRIRILKQRRMRKVL